MFSLTSLATGILLALIITASNYFPWNLSVKTSTKNSEIASLPVSKPGSTPTPTLPQPTINYPTAELTGYPIQSTPTFAPTPTITNSPQAQGIKEAILSLLNNILAKNYWSHTSSDGRQFWSFIDAAGYSYLAAGENLAKGYLDAQSLTSGWMANEGHRNNILNPIYKEVGIGIADGVFEGYQTKLVVAHFAQPS